MRKSIRFGAGAEQCFGLAGGEEFAKCALGYSSDNNLYEGLYKYLKQIKTSTWYPRYIKDTGWEDEKLLEAFLRKNILKI